MVPMLRWMGMTFARFVGLAVTMLGGWLILTNLSQRGYPGVVLAWIVGSGLLGIAGGLTYLFSFDGPAPFRSRRARALGWVAMLASVLLPSSLTMMLIPLVLLVSPTLFLTPAPVPGTEDAVTSE